MISRTTAEFRNSLSRLPDQVRKQAREAHELFIANPHHPSLKFKKLPPHDDIWSARINNNYRAIGRWRGDVIVWFFVGTHADYDRVIAGL